MVFVAVFSSPAAVALDSGPYSLRQLTEVWLDEVCGPGEGACLVQLMGSTRKHSRSQVEAELRSLRTRENHCSWAILDNLSGEFLGVVQLTNFEHSKNSMNLAMVLSSERYQDRGIGTAVIDAVLTYAFDGIHLSSVLASVALNNTRALRLAEKLGFASGRQYNRAGERHQRLFIDKLRFIAAMSERLMGENLDTGKWKFGFDSGKRRAGLCDHTNSRISLSRHMAQLHAVDQSRQVMYHEIAHALAGAKHGHDAQWLRIATDLGYRNERISSREVDERHAKWLGRCPNGHEYFRYRKPTRVSSCSKCSRNYDDRFRIVWEQR